MASLANRHHRPIDDRICRHQFLMLEGSARILCEGYGSEYLISVQGLNHRAIDSQIAALRVLAQKTKLKAQTHHTNNFERLRRGNKRLDRRTAQNHPHIGIFHIDIHVAAIQLSITRYFLCLFHFIAGDFMGCQEPGQTAKIFETWLSYFCVQSEAMVVTLELIRNR